MLEIRAIVAINNIKPGPRTPFLLRVQFLAVYMAASLSLFLLGLLTIIAKPFEVHALVKGQGTPHQRARAKTFLVSLGATFAATLAFFAVNSQL